MIQVEKKPKASRKTPEGFRAADVARYMLEQVSPMPVMTIHRFLYYFQAWSLVWDDRPMFADRIEAWPEGPLVPTVWTLHKNSPVAKAEELAGDPSKLDSNAKQTIKWVLRHYNKYSYSMLSRISRAEAPYRAVRNAPVKDHAQGALCPEISVSLIDALHLKTHGDLLKEIEGAS